MVLDSVFLIILVIVPMIWASYIADKKDRLWLPGYLFISGVVFLAILAFMNSEYAFTGSGDDKDYYQNSLRQLAHLSDWFDFSAVNKRQEQGGYGLLLTWVGQIIGEDLFLRKAVNVSFYLVLSLVWYAIGMTIEGRDLARVTFVMILFAVPLWYYWIFLLKDMTIVLLQSIFLLGMVGFLTGRNVGKNVVRLAISTLLLFPFRVYLVLVNVAVLIASVFIKEGKKKAIGFAGKIVILGVVASILVLGTNKDLLKKMGVGGSNRSLEVASLEGTLKNMDKAKQYQNKSDPLYIVKYPVLFLIGETAGFTPKRWSNLNAGKIRGLTAIPWVFFVPPFFIIGLRAILKRDDKRSTLKKSQSVEWQGDVTASEADNRSLLLLLVFVFVYFVIAWVSTDTTRWRLPVLPAMVCIAAWGWVKQAENRMLILSVWGSALILFVSGYYVMVK